MTEKQKQEHERLLHVYKLAVVKRVEAQHVLEKACDAEALAHEKLAMLIAAVATLPATP